MYPHRFNPSHCWPHSDRSPRPRKSHGDSEERRDPHRDRERPVHHKYSAGRTSRRRDYSTSPKRQYRKDSFDVDRSRRSPLRRRMSFEGDGTRHNHDNTSDSEEGNYRLRHVSAGKTRRWSTDRSDVCRTKDLEVAEFKGKDSRHTRRSPDYRHRHQTEDVNYRHSRDSDSRPSSTRNKDRDGLKSGHCSSERKPSEGHSSKYYESVVAQNQAAVCQQSTSAKGFQRFLDLLNKGVDVDMLNKIVGQTPSDHGVHLTPDIDGQRDMTQQQFSDSTPGEPFSEQSGRSSPSQERSSHPTDSRSRSRSRSPQKVALTPEDKHKHKQMQDVLQAIGLNLGFEELGRMSHRIQERLYGKRENEGQGSEGKSKDSRKVRLPPPRSWSRSSSSSRSHSQSPPERHAESHSLSSQVAAPRDQHQMDLHRADLNRVDQHPVDQHQVDLHQVDLHRGDQHRMHQHRVDQHSGNWHPSDQLPATPTYQSHFPPPGPPMYPPANYPLLPCRPSLPTPPPLPHTPPVPAVFLPPRPPLLRPPLPPLNTFPPQMAHMSHCPPQYAVGPRPWLNPMVQPTDYSNYLRAKTPARPRCLQVIETKQAG